MLWIWGPCSFTILTWWLSGDGFRYIHHRPPQAYIFRGVDNVFFCGQNLYFSWDFHVYILYIQKYVFSYIFTRSLRDEETKFDMMRFYSLIRIFLKPQERAWFFHGEGPHWPNFRPPWRGAWMTSEWRRLVPGGAMVKNSHRNGFFQPKNAAERDHRHRYPSYVHRQALSCWFIRWY